jgi:osmoprotectant transport system substrate-binding protein
LALAVTGCTDSDEETTSTGSDSDSGSATEFQFRPLDAGGPNTKAALEAGDIDIALLFSSDGAIAANDWVILEDDEGLQQAESFVPAIRTEASSDEIAAVLDAVSEGLTDEIVQDSVARVSIDGDNPEAVAADVLEEIGGAAADLTAEGSITIGSANFAESNIAAQLYGQALEAAGVDVEFTPDIGARDVYFTALESGEVDLVPEFTGSLAVFLDPEADVGSDPDAALETARGLTEERGVSLLGIAPAQSANTYVVTSETAEEYDLATVSDLADVDDELTLGGPPECPERPFCIPGLEETYGLTFAS